MILSYVDFYSEYASVYGSKISKIEVSKLLKTISINAINQTKSNETKCYFNYSYFEILDIFTD